MQAWVDAIIGFVEQHQALAPWLMLVFAMAETTAVISIVVPSTAIMVAVGALAATGAINFLPLWLGATVGAVLGSTLSFWLGRRYGAAILATPLLRKHPDWVEKTDRAFVRWGPATILIGHFTTFLRPVVFLMAGMSGMAFVRFTFWNLLGCIAWAWIVPKFGEVGGHLIGWIWSLFS
ncbi:MAG: DedA family protein [Rhodobacteraceae bacterium]|jgi:membrane protein DedA with SNARE-associated domain|nr:DedA family protein [Paracoccaceae bacterium]